MNDLDPFLETLVVPPGRSISLKKDFDPAAKPKNLTKDQSKAKLEEGISLLAEHQEILYAQNTYALLVIFQAMDAAGKDGTIKHVMSGLNPQGCQVFSFKAPSSEELDHDYLWRASRCLPERGRIGIFNRSYYEEVLVVRVHPEIYRAQRLPNHDDKFWKKRFEQIVNYERHLVQNGTVILKFFLHVSRDEQKKRFLDRIEDPKKHWKFSPADVTERSHWNEYVEAYEDMLCATSTKHAPWFVIPADSKWVTRIAVAAVIHRTLRDLSLKFPQPTAEQLASLERAKALLLSEES